MSRFLSREWHSLCRMRTAVTLLAVVAGLSVIATLLPQKALESELASQWIQRHHLLGPAFDQLGLFSVYESWPLVLAATLMYVSLTNCVWTRGRAAYKRWRRGLHRNPQFIGEAGSLVFHLSFFVLLAGVLYNLAGGFAAYVNVLEGESVVEARASYDHVQEGVLFNPADHKGFEVKVDHFNAAYYANTTRPSDFVSHVEVIDRGRRAQESDIRVNEYLDYEGVKFYQASYGWAPVMRIYDPSGKLVFDAPVLCFGDATLSNCVLKAPASGPPGQQIGARMFFAPDAIADSTGVRAGTANLRNPVVDLAVFQGDLHSESVQNVYDIDVTAMHQVWSGGLIQGGSADLPGGYRVAFPRVERYTGLQVNEEPGLPIIYASFVLMVGGLLVRLWLRPLLEWRRQPPEVVTVSREARRVA